MKKTGIIIAVVLALAFIAYFGFRRFDAWLTRGLEEEKSYSRHAMEYHRSHPEKRKGDNVLDTWSDADYIAGRVYSEALPAIGRQVVPR